MHKRDNAHPRFGFPLSEQVTYLAFIYKYFYDIRCIWVFELAKGGIGFKQNTKIFFGLLTEIYLKILEWQYLAENSIIERVVDLVRMYKNINWFYALL